MLCIGYMTHKRVGIKSMVDVFIIQYTMPDVGNKSQIENENSVFSFGPGNVTSGLGSRSSYNHNRLAAREHIDAYLGLFYDVGKDV